MTNHSKITFYSDFFGRLQNMSYFCDMEENLDTKDYVSSRNFLKAFVPDMTIYFLNV